MNAQETYELLVKWDLTILLAKGSNRNDFLSDLHSILLSPQGRETLAQCTDRQGVVDIYDAINLLRK